MLGLKSNAGFSRYNDNNNDNRSSSTIEIANIDINDNNNYDYSRQLNDDARSLTNSSNISSAIIIEKYKKRNFFDYFNNKWRVLFSSIMVITIVIVWSPLRTKTSEELSLRGSNLHVAVSDERLLKLTYALVAIIIPNAFDTIIDVVQFRTLGISWDIHERLLFIFIFFIPPWILIFYSTSLIFPFVYVAMNQSSSVIIMYSINSMISKMEKHQFRYSMYCCSIPCIMMGLAACLKIYGLWNDSLTSIGITLASLAYIIQFVNFVYWTVHIIYTNLKLKSGPGGIKHKQIHTLSLDNIETTVILYFIVLICWMVGIFVSNYITNSITWRDTVAQNLSSFAYLQMVLSLLIIGLPMRWFRNEQIVVYETLAELNRNATSNDNPVLLPNEAIQIAENNTVSLKKVVAPCYEQVTVLYIDLKNTLTSLENGLSVENSLLVLDILFTICDYCTSLFMHEGLEKIESVGSSYLVICGDSKHSEHASIISNFAAILNEATNCVLHPTTNKKLDIRMGIHSGNIILGKVGFLSTRLGLFGTTIDVAMDAASNCDVGKIMCTQEVVTAIAESAFDMPMLNLRPREFADSKTFYWIDRPIRPLSSDTFMSELLDKCNLIIRTKLSSCDVDNSCEQGEQGEELL